MIRFLLFLLLLSTAIGCNKSSPHPEEIIDSKRLGQMILIGFRVTEIDGNHPIVRDLRELNIGGVVLYDYDRELGTFGRNIESQDQLLQLSSDLISNASTPPIIAVHQDGGIESPLNKLYPTAISPFSKTLFSDSTTTISYSRSFAQEFMVLGLNTNFNPRLDLKTPSNKAPTPGIISSDPEIVIQQANYILNEYDKEHLFSVPKYFPGYSSDYHPADSTNNITDVWSEDFLKPYQSLLSEREISGIMTAHSFNANIDSVWPATLSKKTITGLLRDSLGFEGVVISDDLQKPIITSRYDRETAIAQSLNAGVDILYFGNNFKYDKDLAPKVLQAIQQVMADGRVSKDTVEESLNRIEKLKKDVIEELCSCFNF